jgi:hypothetical protein
MKSSAPKSWHVKFHDSALLYVRNRLLQCSSLRHVAREAAAAGLARFRRSVSDASFYCDEYQSPLTISQRWVNISVYRESLRVLIECETVQDTFRMLPFEQRRILRFCYQDQLTIEEIAKATGKVLELRNQKDTTETAQEVVLAYQKFCDQLNRFHPAANFVPGRLAEYPWVFPVPPNISTFLRTGVIS